MIRKRRRDIEQQAATIVDWRIALGMDEPTFLRLWAARVLRADGTLGVGVNFRALGDLEDAAYQDQPLPLHRPTRRDYAARRKGRR